VSDLAAQRQVNRGYDDGLSRAIELVLTPLFLGGIGFALDAWLGTRPFLAIGLGVAGVVGIFVKLWLGYDREMRAHEAEAPWRRSPAERAAAATEAPAPAAASVPGPAAAPVPAPAGAHPTAPSPVRPGYVSALAATLRYFRNQAATGKATTRADAIVAPRAAGPVRPAPAAPPTPALDEQGIEP
jgi:hypothetical protein